jgi:phenylalanyl-tRNA synthetase beta chain
MLISWEWLADYVTLDAPIDQVVDRWALSGLNHESTEWVEGVPVIDLEVTSNRADCLGHIGIAREAAVLYSQALKIPAVDLPTSKQSVHELLEVENLFPEACPRYTARVIRGVKIGPSPEWFAKRLRTIGIRPINNVVDATNYVMMEYGQPLHAFDLNRIASNRIVVRPATQKENFKAIDHRSYVLDPQMVVIGDSKSALALGGVMGGSDSEVSETTVDLLIEAASFEPMAIRRTARRLKLHSPSSHRFERRIDPQGLDFASQRCCQWILQFAGGQLLDGWIDTHAEPKLSSKVLLRRSRITRVLGIEVPWDRCQDILSRLGCSLETDQDTLVAVPPSFRQDLTREIDLIEEIARVHGYEAIPEDAMVPMVASAARPKDTMMHTVRSIACASGFSETLNPSLIGKSPIDRISPWTLQDPLGTSVPLLEGASHLRRSLIPSLIAARLHNQSQSNRDVRLFETANVYLSHGDQPRGDQPRGDQPRGDQPRGDQPRGDQLPKEQYNFGCIAESEPRLVRGVFEEMIDRVWGHEGPVLEERMVDFDFLDKGSSIAWFLRGTMIAWVGSLSRSLAQSNKIDGPVALGELDLDLLLASARSVPKLRTLSPYPAILRDLNFIVDEGVLWGQMRATIEQAAGELCKEVLFREIYRVTKRDGEGKKRVLLTLTIQSDSETLKGEQADAVVSSVVSACEAQRGAKLLAG